VARTLYAGNGPVNLIFGAMLPEPRRYRAGESIEDLCRACKVPRGHTVMAVDGGGRVLRVVCGFCGSNHNYRGGGGDAPRTPRSAPAPGREPFPLVAETERSAPAMSVGDGGPDLEMLLRRVIREESGLTPVAPADRWRGGQLVLRPGNGTQEKSWPIETFFHKVVMLRNRLRTLEQQVNASDLPDEQKVKLQSYVTGCYGSLTSFNVLFADEDDQFKGSAE
jgi:hypothetical protein